MSESGPDVLAVRDMITVVEAMTVLGLTRFGVNSAVSSGTLPSLRVSPVPRLIPRSAVEEYRQTQLGTCHPSKLGERRPPKTLEAQNPS